MGLAVSEEMVVDGDGHQHRINIKNAFALRQWCRRFQRTERKLRDAVEFVGPMAYNVREYVFSECNCFGALARIMLQKLPRD